MDKCFIIMPISTPGNVLQYYNNDDAHFRNILEHLFIPVLEKIGYDVQKPMAEGSEIIHSRIIDNLFHADMVLCDISILNPNVFFELGIRTALNKKVCLVKDDVTGDIPFDTTFINVHSYSSSMPAWDSERQKDALEKHIIATKEQKNENALWSVFGTRLDKVVEISDSSDDEIGLLRTQNKLLKELSGVNAGQYETSASVFRAKAHKCSHCGYSFILNDSISTLGAYVSTAVMPFTTSLLSNVPERNVVRCPKCKNLDVLQ